MPRPARALRLACPVCGAEPGAPCFSSMTGALRAEPHPERRALALSAPDADLDRLLSECRAADPALSWLRVGFTITAYLSKGWIVVTLARITAPGLRRVCRRVAAADVVSALAEIRGGTPAPRRTVARTPVPDLDTVIAAAPGLTWSLNAKGSPVAKVGDCEVTVNTERVHLRRGGAVVARLTVGGDLPGAIGRAVKLTSKENS